MLSIKPLVLASHNQGKLRELQKLLGDSFQLRSVSEFSSDEPEETGLSFIENAIIKARFASKVSGLPSLADDSGLAVDILKGAPGIYSARYADGQGDTANNQKLLQTLENIPSHQRTAQFICALALVRHEQDPMPIICEGIWKGSILFQAQGQNGFGYDPLFWVEQYQCSSAELSPELKNCISHRALAIQALQQRFTQL